MSEAKKLLMQFALVIGLWVIASFVWARFIKPRVPKFKESKGGSCKNSQLLYNQYYL